MAASMQTQMMKWHHRTTRHATAQQGNPCANCSFVQFVGYKSSSSHHLSWWNWILANAVSGSSSLKESWTASAWCPGCRVLTVLPDLACDFRCGFSPNDQWWLSDRSWASKSCSYHCQIPIHKAMLNRRTLVVQNFWSVQCLMRSQLSVGPGSASFHAKTILPHDGPKYIMIIILHHFFHAQVLISHFSAGHHYSTVMEPHATCLAWRFCILHALLTRFRTFKTWYRGPLWRRLQIHSAVPLRVGCAMLLLPSLCCLTWFALLPRAGRAWLWQSLCQECIGGLPRDRMLVSDVQPESQPEPRKHL